MSATLVVRHLGDALGLYRSGFFLLPDPFLRLGQKEFDVCQTLANARLELVLDIVKLHWVLVSENGRSDLFLEVGLRLAFLFKPIEVLGVKHVKSVILPHQDL